MGDRVLGAADKARMLDSNVGNNVGNIIEDNETGATADNDAMFKEPGIFDGIAAQIYAMRAQLDAVLVQLAAMERMHAARPIDTVATARAVASEMERDAKRRTAPPATFMRNE